MIMGNMTLKRSLCLLSVFCFSGLVTGASDKSDGQRLPASTVKETEGEIAAFSPIRPYAENPWYWEYQGEPILLRGGSDEDNPYQWTGRKLIDQLDLLASVGGNYLRNTMSDRDRGNVHAFKQTEEGLYDLDQWNQEYWDRLTFFLQETAKRGIIVQLTLWDQFDHSRRDNPWHAENNISYSSSVISGRGDFYNTVKTNNKEGLHYQQKYIDKLLSITFTFDHVLYNIENESSKGEVWENYWARFIHQAAKNANRKAYVTIMRFDPANSVRAAMTFRDIYNFIEISQNNQDSRGARGPAHWENIINWRQKLAYHSRGPMPMNNVKMYGAQDGGTNYSAGTETEAINRFWRNIFAGCASSRFHRPSNAWGSGLNERVQMNLKAMDLFLEKFKLFSAAPHNDLLRHIVASAPIAMEAYVLADIGRQYAVYFPRGRFMVGLEPWVYVNKVSIRWLNIEELTWSEPEIIEVQWEGSRDEWGHRAEVVLKTPDNKSYIALLDVVEMER